MSEKADTSDNLSLVEMAGEMFDRGTRRVHVLAWRDFDDNEAGGSENHAD